VPWEFAYLSACETASVNRLPDESIHVASAFHVAGYRQVVGTLWPTSDRVAARMATTFYTAMTGAGTRADAGRCAQALHEATRQQRRRWPHQPTLWAGYIHVGV
jgi:CHAT domain-containing protein